jgi:hypothetical protein
MSAIELLDKTKRPIWQERAFVAQSRAEASVPIPPSELKLS